MTNLDAAEMIRNDMKIHHDYLSGQYRKALNMAIDALLEEQEAVKPKCKERIGGFVAGICPKCGTALNNVLNVKACGKCGQAVKWE